jgi:hypothetical protein
VNCFVIWVHAAQLFFYHFNGQAEFCGSLINDIVFSTDSWLKISVGVYFGRQLKLLSNFAMEVAGKWDQL